MTLAESVDRFIDALRFEREMSENTCAAYARDLRAFAAFARRQGADNPADVTRAHIAEFLRGE
ncbi:MAG: site-specific integrase, partial [Kiritimatiellae bacterium]|nr:site-specific integrase [Kiritimatiellia bacterium]